MALKNDFDHNKNTLACVRNFGDNKEIKEFRLHHTDNIEIISYGKTSLGVTSLFAFTSSQVTAIPTDYNGYLCMDLKSTFSLLMRDKLVGVFQREFIWYVVSNHGSETVLDVYDSEFKICRSVKIHDDQTTDVQMRGTSIFLAVHNTLLEYDVLNETTRVFFRHHTPINGFVISMFLILLFETPNGSFIDILNSKNILMGRQMFGHGNAPLKIYFAENDCRFNLSHMFCPIQQSVPRHVLEPLLSKHMHVCESSCDPDTAYIENGFISFTIPEVVRPAVFNVDMNMLSSERRHVIQIVNVEENMRSFLLFSHPNSGDTHFIPDIKDNVKLLYICSDFKNEFQVHATFQNVKTHFIQEIRVSEKICFTVQK